MRIPKECLQRVREVEHELWHLRVLEEYSRRRQLELIHRRAPAQMLNRYTEDREELAYEIAVRENELAYIARRRNRGRGW